MPLDLEPPLADADITWFNPSFFWASGALVSNVDDLDRSCPATPRDRSACSATTRTPAWSPTPNELYVALTNALVALFCDLNPAQAAAAARAHPDRAAVIRFR
jgi:hypothetical protein